MQRGSVGWPEGRGKEVREVEIRVETESGGRFAIGLTHLLPPQLEDSLPRRTEPGDETLSQVSRLCSDTTTSTRQDPKANALTKA